jgi:hypothetical protein
VKLIVHFTGILFLAFSFITSSYGAEGPPTVLFDQGHGQKFVVGDNGPLQLSSLATIFTQKGFKVQASSAPLTDEVLANVQAIVLSGPFKTCSPTEIDALVRFLERGGKLVAMLHIGQPLDTLLQRLGVAFSNGVIHEQQHVIGDNPLNLFVTNFQPHPITQGLETFSLYGGWALINTGTNASVIATTSPEAWIDLNGDRKLSKGDAVQSFGVIVAGTQGSGSFVIFGDDAIFQNQFLDENNKHLAGNLAEWLK